MWLSTPHDDTELFPHIFKYSLFVSGSNPFLWRALYYIFVSLHVFSIINCFLLLPGNASSHRWPLSGTNQQTTHTIQLAHQSAYSWPLLTGEDGLTRTELNMRLRLLPYFQNVFALLLQKLYICFNWAKIDLIRLNFHCPICQGANLTRLPSSQNDRSVLGWHPKHTWSTLHIQPIP